MFLKLKYLVVLEPSIMNLHFYEMLKERRCWREKSRTLSVHDLRNDLHKVTSLLFIKTPIDRFIELKYFCALQIWIDLFTVQFSNVALALAKCFFMDRSD